MFSFICPPCTQTSSKDRSMASQNQGPCIFVVHLAVRTWGSSSPAVNAGQSVLEGLNALLDHRAEVFIPELGATFQCPPTFRIFAAQNPVQEGGGRRGLPKSFLNRFTRVHVELLDMHDLHFISGMSNPSSEACSGYNMNVRQDLPLSLRVEAKLIRLGCAMMKGESVKFLN